MKEYIVKGRLDNKTGFMSFTVKQELIRCRDCKYYDGYYCHNKWWGDGHGYYTPPIKKDDGYCDWAERRG